MTGQEPGDMARLFAGLVPEDVISAYEKLRAEGGVFKDHAEQFLGDARLVAELRKRGMANTIPHTPSAPATFQPASPELALLGVLAELQATLSQNQKMLLEGHRRLTDAQSRPMRTADGTAEHLVRVITDREEILRTSKHLINSAHRDWMTLETHETDMPLTDDYPIDVPTALRQQVRIRSIYDIAFTEHPDASRYIEEFVRAGEEARILPTVPIKMQLADIAVLLPLTQNGASGALLIKDGPVPRAMRIFFEMLWARATPFGSTGPQPDSPLSPAEQRILELLAAGKQDKAIARSVKQSETTVRRHIKAITDRLELKTTSRFALGLAIGRSGWLTCDNENPASDKDGHD